jgi:hypothetical protein
MGDTIRAIVAFIATAIVLALLSEPPIRWGLLGIASGVFALCVITARSRLGVVLGVAAIVAGRLIVVLILALARSVF